MATVSRERETMPGRDSLKARYESVQTRVAEAATRGGRNGGDIVVVAVTKHAAIDQIRELIALGHRDFGENRTQTLVQHAAQVEDYLDRRRQLRRASGGELPADIRWHMIGHLQRNKVRKTLELVRLVHSVDSLRLAEEIQQAAAAVLDKPAEVLIQVNIGAEKQKHGIAPAATRHLIEQIDTMFNVRVRGLMTMAPLTEDRAVIRSVFQRGRELFEDIRRSGGVNERFNILSMGMSSDYELAVECGANIVRVGTAIFGPPADGDDAADDLS
ncbi:MAG: YggS family pyridoxal phosphate-dependent enzyme [Phycisphaerae bacterium]|nr:YggS family pyridoxal phosphate-dependent enzyme [Phycisphaerae bacterium]